MEMPSWGTPLLSTDPAKACHTHSTCVECPCKDPALAKSDWPEARFLPLLEDLHTTVPVPGVQATSVVAAPIPSNHTIVVIAIDLGRKKPQENQHRQWHAEFRGQGREMRKEAREPLSGCFVSL